MTFRALAPKPSKSQLQQGILHETFARSLADPSLARLKLTRGQRNVSKGGLLTGY